MTDPIARRGDSLRVVVLTQRSPRGVSIAAALASADVRVEAIVVDIGSTVSRDRVKRAVKELVRSGVADSARRVVTRLRRAWIRRRRDDALRQLRRCTKRLVTVSDANGPDCESILRSLSPDLLVLGSSRILRSNILEIPHIGILNPHPGMLPEYRGLDVIAWAIYNGDPLGVTVHLVDPGIDTGDIVAQKTFDVQPGDTLRSVRRRADAILGQLMVKVVAQLMTSGHLERRRQVPGSGHLYPRMSASEKQAVESRLGSAARSV